jgi:uncharacterized protein YegL
MQSKSVEFLYSAQWDDDDQIGYVSFASASDTTLESPLPSERIAVQNKIENTLTVSGGTAIGSGIDEAMDEQLGVHGRSGAFRVQVLLSDGQNNDGPNPLTVAQNAADNNIMIFTIGFGEDADETLLQNIANITGGAYHYAGDANALDDVYALIAQEVVAAAGIYQAFDTNVLVPLPNGIVVVDPGNGTVQNLGDGNYLVFDIGDINSSTPWSDSYIVTIPCIDDYSCSITQMSFPDTNTLFYYDDINGILQTPLPWDEFAIVTFKYRDLTVEYLDGEVVDFELFLDINASNIGYLDAGATHVGFYLNDVNGPLIADQNINALCSPFTPGCQNSSQIIYDIIVADEGTIYAVINPEGSIRECPSNNVAKITCTFGGILQYYVMDYWMWVE